MQVGLLLLSAAAAAEEYGCWSPLLCFLCNKVLIVVRMIMIVMWWHVNQRKKCNENEGDLILIITLSAAANNTTIEQWMGHRNIGIRWLVGWLRREQEAIYRWWNKTMARDLCLCLAGGGAAVFKKPSFWGIKERIQYNIIKRERATNSFSEPFK